MTMPPPPDWALVIPVKPLDRAKSRLAGLAGPRRGELALAMAADTVPALLASPAMAVVIVVTDDASLVVPRERAQDVRGVIDELKKRKQNERL